MELSSFSSQLDIFPPNAAVRLAVLADNALEGPSKVGRCQKLPKLKDIRHCKKARQTHMRSVTYEAAIPHLGPD